ncbi:MAG TPA: peptide chain release factor N(5)-glutamine methyltransferase [Chthoniobacterales bacterium]
MTVLEVLQVSTDYFNKHQVDSARLSAEHLLAHVLGRKRIELYLEFDRALNESELVPLRELVRRRGEGEPLQHLLGTVEFCGQMFVCDKRAMVPRPETEELVELLVSDFRLQGSEPRILDVGTGSGVIALSLAGRVPEAKIVATDISDDALDLAMENATRLDLTARVQFVKSNLFEGLVERFDLIVANLPYIAMADRTSLSREVLRDPEVALFGGDHGDELIRRLVAGAPEKLVPGGLLALEIGLGQADAILLALAEKKYEDIAAKNDYSGRPRFVFARYG